MTARRGGVEAGYRGREKRRVVGVVVLLLALALGAGIYLGQRAVYSGLGIDVEAYRDMKTELPRLRDALAGVSAELEMSRTRHEVDRQALEMVRREITTQKEQHLAEILHNLRTNGPMTWSQSFKTVVIPKPTFNRYLLRLKESGQITRENDEWSISRSQAD